MNLLFHLFFVISCNQVAYLPNLFLLPFFPDKLIWSDHRSKHIGSQCTSNAFSLSSPRAHVLTCLQLLLCTPFVRYTQTTSHKSFGFPLDSLWKAKMIDDSTKGQMTTGKNKMGQHELPFWKFQWCYCSMVLLSLCCSNYSMFILVSDHRILYVSSFRYLAKVNIKPN